MGYEMFCLVLLDGAVGIAISLLDGSALRMATSSKRSTVILQ
jgi:hypothetical protein